MLPSPTPQFLASRGAARSRRRPPLRGPAAVLTAVVTLAPSAGCSVLIGDPHPEARQEITITSPLIQEGETIPDRYTCQGEGISPPLQWSGLPTDTEAIAIVVDDSEARGAPLVHWVVVGLAPDEHELPEGAVPTSATQAQNSRGEAEYLPPCPGDEESGGDDPGGTGDDEGTAGDGETPDATGTTVAGEVPAHNHGYRFTVYALRSNPGLAEDVPLDVALGAIADRAIAWGRLFAVGE